MLVRSNAVDVIVIDSVAALVPRAELDGDMGDSLLGLQARLMSPGAAQAHRRHLPLRHLVIFINQIREKIGVMFGSPGDDDRRPRPQVLRLRPDGHPPHRTRSRRAPSRSACAPR